MNKEYIAIPPISQINVPFKIELAGITYEDPYYRIERSKSDVCIVEYVISGSGVLTVDGKVYKAYAGDMYIIPSYSKHSYYSDSVDPWRKIWFNASGNLCNELMRIYGIENKILFKGADGYKYMKDMLNLCEQKDISIEEMNTSATLIFTEIVMFLSNKEKSSDIISNEAESLKKYIDMNIERNITIKELSDLIFRSKSQTIRIFKNAYDKTPYDYLLEQKIRRAGTLFKSTSLPIKEVAFRLGFCDEHYFSNIFKKKTGFTPTEFKNKKDYLY